MSDKNTPTQTQAAELTEAEKIAAERPGIERLYDELIEQLLSYHPTADTTIIRKAFEYAYEKHLHQRRKSGEPYIIHPVGVAKLVTQIKMDEASVCAALLHDVVEDTDATYQDIVRDFNEEIATLVDALTKLDKHQFTSSEDRQAANFCKMLLSMNSDLRCILIKLADRVHNMRTLQHMRPDKQVTIAQETLDIYAPIANRLGIDWIKGELEDLSLKYLHPEEYADLAKKVENLMKDKADFIDRVKGILAKSLEAEGIKTYKLKGRVKHIYSIYRKLKRSSTPIAFEKLHDVIAFRVIVPTKTDCYHVLGIVHGMWTLVENRFKDYIARPKANNYQSLHTSVIGPDHEYFEIQIRTYDMDQVAEEGIAAHWKYKEGNMSPARVTQDFDWLHKLMETRENNVENPNSQNLLKSVKLDLFSDEIYAFTPTGEIKTLPLGSTPIDFAYAIHSVVGDHCFRAKVNDCMVPLRYKLQTGDVVEIETRDQQHPNTDWLQMVASPRAKAKINKYLANEEKNMQAAIGKQLVEKGLRKAHLSLSAIDRLSDADMAKLLQGLKIQTLEGLYIELGAERLKFENVLERLMPIIQTAEPDVAPEPEQTITEAFTNKTNEIVNKITKRSQTNVYVDGIDNVVIHFAKCCSPVPGEPIVGFITRGRGLAIHNVNCPRIRELESDRLITCNWDPSISGSSVATRLVSIHVTANDRVGILQNVLKVMSEMNINITQSHCRTKLDTDECLLTFEVQIIDLSQLNKLLMNIRKVQGVVSAVRAAT